MQSTKYNLGDWISSIVPADSVDTLCIQCPRDFLASLVNHPGMAGRAKLSDITDL